MMHRLLCSLRDPCSTRGAFSSVLRGLCNGEGPARSGSFSREWGTVCSAELQLLLNCMFLDLKRRGSRTRQTGGALLVLSPGILLSPSVILCVFIYFLSFSVDVETTGISSLPTRYDGPPFLPLFSYPGNFWLWWDLVLWNLWWGAWRGDEEELYPVELLHHIRQKYNLLRLICSSLSACGKREKWKRASRRGSESAAAAVIQLSSPHDKALQKLGLELWGQQALWWPEVFATASSHILSSSSSSSLLSVCVVSISSSSSSGEARPPFPPQMSHSSSLSCQATLRPCLHPDPSAFSLVSAPQHHQFQVYSA